MMGGGVPPHTPKINPRAYRRRSLTKEWSADLEHSGKRTPNRMGKTTYQATPARKQEDLLGIQAIPGMI